MRILRSFSIFALISALPLSALAQSPRQGQRPGARMAEMPKPKSVTHNGRPAIEFEGAGGWGVYIVMGPHQGEPSLGFAVAQGNCQGMLFVTRTRISGDFRNSACENFDVAREGSTVERVPGKIVLASGASKYELTPQAERNNERQAIRIMGSGAELIPRAINNFDAAFRNVRRTIMEAQAGSQPQPTTPAAAKTAATEKQSPATLTIASDPGDVQVYVNDEPKGMTSTEGREVLRLPAGTYRVRLSLPGYKDFEQQVVVAAGKDYEVKTQLETAGPPPFKESDVTEMLQGKMSPKRIATLVQERGVDFEVNSDVEKRFRGMGATSDLLLVMAENRKK